MKRVPRSVLYAVAVLLAFTSASEAAADDGMGPLGVTTVAAASAWTARVGALFAADRGSRLAGGHFCTASVVHSPRRDLLVTAAHCLSGTGELVFVPGYRDGHAPYGVWKVGKTYLPDGWAKRQDEDSDVGFADVGERHGERVEDVVGGNRFVTGTATGATAVTVTGYPDSREVPVSCTNKPAAHSRTQQRIECPGFTGGTSGSPWVDGDGKVVGILGGHEEGGATADVSYSVVLGGEAAALYRTAAIGPCPGS
ncbi:trypsin-like peptidase domain-containing protein [Streptomyces sp. NL15-2K]|uniref:trypsin-like peptidase domain-containing protein n=1 Tax=Streptomyces sp. NL15-2K TaxID=376149 RepID=UPI000F57FC07|nr:MULTISPECIES: trypsin-like peptidase domain-containing protein [Actinomycetes]WKX10452.1 trypsin-like peptidase domain-containing protein [Kutzneria buriramensis]GCB48019.1 V8-like glu-specific endopeptidase [Streptomyces sp. NL15-2K]